MADWPVSLSDGQRTQSGIAAPPSPTVVTAGTVHNKGTSFTQLLSATAFDAAGIYITLGLGTSATCLHDIAIGAATFETVIIRNLLSSCTVSDQIGSETYFPIAIPAGTRISARAQGTVASAFTRCGVRLQGMGGMASSPRSIVQTIGAVAISTVATQGASLGSSSAHTWTAWKLLATDVAGTVADLPLYPIEQVLLSIQMPGSALNTSYIFELGIGPTGSEQSILRFTNVSQLNQKMGTTWFGPFPCSIPAGTQIQMRYRSVSANSSPLHVALYGVS